MPSDIKILQNPVGVYDVGYTSYGDIQTVDGFETAIMMSVICERRATADQVPLAQNRRGWIGDTDQTDPIGSYVWLYDQSKRNSDTLNGIKTAAADGLAWLPDAKTEVSANFIRDGVELIATITVENNPTETVFFPLWSLTNAA